MELDYSKLGFKAGLECHQQLEGRKLFCRCPTLNSRKEPDLKATRMLRAVIGEMDEMDIAAKHETEKGRYYIYESNSEDTCEIEYDECPPEPMNQEALKTALQVAKLLNAKIVDEIQTMRKTIVDGSNVSGFQRTSLVATDGYIHTSKGKVGIPTILLEEEAAQKIESKEKYVRYRLSRLGIPLIEIATDASIKDPEHAKEAAKKIGMILRSTGKVKRGIGTIRQDVNVSIKGGARTEIKGFQDLKSIPKVINYEIERQLKLIKQKKKLRKEVRKAEPDFTTTFLRPIPGAARMYPETDVMPTKVKKEWLNDVEMPELIEDKAKRYEKLGLGNDLAILIARSGRAVLFERLIKNKKIKPAFIAETLMSAKRNVKNQFNVEIDPSDGDFELLFEELNKGRIAKDSVMNILKENKPVKSVIKKFELMSDKELEKELKKIISANKGVQFNALIGRAMGKLKGKADGKKIVEMLKKLSR